ncbi:protein YELLOW LEAF 1, choloroplastic-like [Dioscorea cayenensis subsp. rotundata]|uniref:Protein YELLOW LEAF 1, choloroplastic-like n=1 Tax=Dioscorea cayennensis subsp. rotundata TaxID=55577 RepID=A0AB40AV65_DIOCR|nr:protein YELLOW LEAF 1, choloroplastic-like [Dioscorea cayenensis subsp. rotundata]
MVVALAPAISPPLLRFRPEHPRPLQRSRVLVSGTRVVLPLRISNEGLRGATAVRSRMVVLCMKNQLSQQRNGVLHHNQLPSAAMICAAALTQRCAAEQTQTVQRPSSTITKAPNEGKEKSQDRPPKLDDGGNGYPPYYFGGGGGGGGGGWSSSGGFYVFAFLIFLDYLKELEENKEKQKRRKQHATDDEFTSIPSE